MNIRIANINLKKEIVQNVVGMEIPQNFLITESNNMEIKYLNSKESFGMSGPWIGELLINDQILEFQFLDNNFVKSENGILYVFNRFRVKNEIIKFLFNLLSTNNSKREFQILIFDSENHKWYLSNKIYKSLYLTRFKNGQIFFTNAFHNDDKQMFPEKSIDFNDKNFIELHRTEVIKTQYNNM